MFAFLSFLVLVGQAAGAVLALFGIGQQMKAAFA